MRLRTIPLLLLAMAGSWEASQGQEAKAAATRGPATTGDGLASVSGIVVNAVTAKPVEGAHVILAQLSAQGMHSSTYGALSDKAGNFSIRPIEPANYLLMVERTGFIFVRGWLEKDSPLRMLALKPGQQATTLRLEMAPRSVIAGHVYDEYGEPLNAAVEAVPVKPRNELEQMLNTRRASTNDRGEFRISVPPGKFYIKAQPSFSRGGPPEVRSDGTEDANYLPTYYPGVGSVEAATPVETQPGGESYSIEIPMLRSAALSISGTVSNIPENVHSASISLEYGPSRNRTHSSSQSGFGSGGKLDGRFNFEHVAPGFYRIWASTSAEDGGLQSQIVEITLSNASADNINLALVPGMDVSGVVELSGATEAGLRGLGRQTVKLQAGFGEARSRRAEVAADGSFAIKNVGAGRYRVLVESLPEHGYIKAVRLNGAEAPRGIFELESGGELKIVLSANGGQVSGKVESTSNSDGNFGRRVVVLAPNDLSEITTNEDLQFSDTGTDGKYNFPAVPPGRYKLGVLDWNTSEIAEDIKRYGDRFLTLDVKEGDRIVKDLKPIKKEDDGDTPK